VTDDNNNACTGSGFVVVLVVIMRMGILALTEFPQLALTQCLKGYVFVSPDLFRRFCFRSFVLHAGLCSPGFDSPKVVPGCQCGRAGLSSDWNGLRSNANGG
jgi:hypothetical protein